MTRNLNSRDDLHLDFQVSNTIRFFSSRQILDLICVLKGAILGLNIVDLSYYSAN